MSARKQRDGLMRKLYAAIKNALRDGCENCGGRLHVEEVRLQQSVFDAPYYGVTPGCVTCDAEKLGRLKRAMK